MFAKEWMAGSAIFRHCKLF